MRIFSVHVLTLIIVEDVRRRRQRSTTVLFSSTAQNVVRKKMYLVLPFTHSALVGSFWIVIKIGVAAGVVVR